MCVEQTREEVRLSLHHPPRTDKVELRRQDVAHSLKLLIGPRHCAGEPLREEGVQPQDLGLAAVLQRRGYRWDDTVDRSGMLMTCIAVLVLLVSLPRTPRSGQRTHIFSGDFSEHANEWSRSVVEVQYYLSGYSTFCLF